MDGINQRPVERWTCSGCGHTETAPSDELAGSEVTKTVGSGRRERTITTAVCPECGSGDWHSDPVRQALLTADAAIRRA